MNNSKCLLIYIYIYVYTDLVVLIEDFLHDLPKALLPLENRLLRHHIWLNIARQAARKEVMRQVAHVVQRVVVGHHHVLVILQHAVVAEARRAAVVREEGGHHSSCTNGLPASSVFSSDSVSFEVDGGVVAQLHALDVDGVSADGDAVPAAAHGSVRTAQCLLQAQALHL